MILVHDPNLLSKLVLRTVTRNLGVKHSGLFLYNKNKKEYVITVSSGKKGLKIPVGFTKITNNNPIIQFFLNKDIKENKEYLLISDIKVLKEKYRDNEHIYNLLTELEDQTYMYKAQLIVPGFFRKDLMVVFFIGNKTDGTFFNEEDLEFLTILSSDVVTRRCPSATGRAWRPQSRPAPPRGCPRRRAGRRACSTPARRYRPRRPGCSRRPAAF